MSCQLIKRRSLLLSTSLTLGALFSASACTPTEGEGDVIRVGLINPATGALETFGPALENGVRLALDEINEGGGVLERTIELVVKDSATDPDVSRSAAEALIDDDGVIAIIGAAGSGNSVAVAEITSDRGVPQLTGASTSPALTDLDDNGFVFRTVPSDAFQGIVLADEIKAAGHGSVAVLHIDNAYGSGLAAVLSDRFVEGGGTVTTTYSYPENVGADYDYQAALTEVYATSPDAIALVAYAGDGTSFLSTWNDNGGFDGSWFLSDGMRSDEIATAVGAGAVEGITGTAPVFGAGAQYDSFAAAYEASHGEEPGIFADTYYDAMILIGLAIVKAGVTDGAALRDALPEVAGPPGGAVGFGRFADAASQLTAGEDLDYRGASGEVDFDANGDVAGPVEVWRFSGGSVVQNKVVTP